MSILTMLMLKVTLRKMIKMKSTKTTMMWERRVLLVRTWTTVICMSHARNHPVFQSTSNHTRPTIISKLEKMRRVYYAFVKEHQQQRAISFQNMKAVGHAIHAKTSSAGRVHLSLKKITAKKTRFITKMDVNILFVLTVSSATDLAMTTNKMLIVAICYWSQK